MTNQAIVQFSRQEYEELCNEMKDLLTEEKERAARKSELRDQIIKIGGGDRMEYGIKLQYRTSKGTIDYSRYVKSLKVEPEVLEFYRKDDREYWEIRSY